MIICVCNNFNEAALDQAVAIAQANGDTRPRAVYMIAAKGQPLQCGKCLPFCKDRIAICCPPPPESEHPSP